MQTIGLVSVPVGITLQDMVPLMTAFVILPCLGQVFR